jgi:uncharacterized caspase-like protein
MTAAALDFEAVRLDLVQRTMEREAQTSIIFLDACRDNPLARNLTRAMGTRSAQVGRGLAAVESGVGTLDVDNTDGHDTWSGSDAFTISQLFSTRSQPFSKNSTDTEQAKF